MTEIQENLFDKLATATANLIYQGHQDLAERLGDVLDALSAEDFVLALIIAKIRKLPEKVCQAIKETYQIKDID